jgi:GrpB-like predicted nucleotidyltransferase (UPF0157 family)
LGPLDLQRLPHTHPEAAKEYGDLKIFLSRKFPNDKAAYASGKTEFIELVMKRARQDLQAIDAH